MIYKIDNFFADGCCEEILIVKSELPIMRMLAVIRDLGEKIGNREVINLENGILSKHLCSEHGCEDVTMVFEEKVSSINLWDYKDNQYYKRYKNLLEDDVVVQVDLNGLLTNNENGGEENA